MPQTQNREEGEEEDNRSEDEGSVGQNRLLQTQNRKERKEDNRPRGKAGKSAMEVWGRTDCLKPKTEEKNMMMKRKAMDVGGVW